jgi:hypothetical protein
MSAESHSRRPTLPALAAVGAACYQCYSPTSESVKLLKCSGCHLVSYCNSCEYILPNAALLDNSEAACQHESWPSHKHFCRVISSFEKEPLLLSTAMWIGSSAPDELEAQVTGRFSYCQRKLGRPLSPQEEPLLHFEPRCLSW